MPVTPVNRRDNIENISEASPKEDSPMFTELYPIMRF